MYQHLFLLYHWNPGSNGLSESYSGRRHFHRHLPRLGRNAAESNCGLFVSTYCSGLVNSRVFHHHSLQFDGERHLRTVHGQLVHGQLLGGDFSLAHCHPAHSGQHRLQRGGILFEHFVCFAHQLHRALHSMALRRKAYLKSCFCEPGPCEHDSKVDTFMVASNSLNLQDE